MRLTRYFTHLENFSQLRLFLQQLNLVVEIEDLIFGLDSELAASAKFIYFHLKTLDAVAIELGRLLHFLQLENSRISHTWAFAVHPNTFVCGIPQSLHASSHLNINYVRWSIGRWNIHFIHSQKRSNP